MLTNHVEKQTRRYTIVVAKDNDGIWRRKKVMNKSDKVTILEVLQVDG